MPGLKLGIADWRKQARLRLGEGPVESSGYLAYTPGQVLQELPIQFSAERIVQLAPRFSLEQGDSADRIGIPRRVNGALIVDTQRPEVYYLFSKVWFEGQLLDQIIYVAWFPRRPAQGRFDPYAGELDGLMWRVTLDTDGQVLLYDSIHPCGCFHQALPTPELVAREQSGMNEEGLFIAGTVSRTEPVVIHLSAGEHHIQQVSAKAESVGHDALSYTLVPYDALRLARPERLFDSTGIVAGSERGERLFLWPAGVRSPGAMRQWGRHATAFVGRRHFDDPYLLDRYFERQ